MTERAILFSAPMVRALLAGTKTQTRRIVKLREFGPSTTRDYDFAFRDSRMLWNDYRRKDLIARRCPYGVVGDRLWVREGLCLVPGAAEYAADGQRVNDMHAGAFDWLEARSRSNVPSIHMPRWASRLTLTITDVRVQRLHEITEDDAIAEGVDSVSLLDMRRPATRCRREDFAQIWQKINGAGAWERNDWVWALTFERVA